MDIVLWQIMFNPVFLVSVFYILHLWVSLRVPDLVIFHFISH